MITFLEYKNNSEPSNSDFKKVKKSLKENGYAIVSLSTDDNKIQVKQFDKIKKEIGYKPDKNLKFYWNNSNNFVVIDSEKIDILNF